MQRAPMSINGPNHLGMCALQSEWHASVKQQQSARRMGTIDRALRRITFRLQREGLGQTFFGWKDSWQLVYRTRNLQRKALSRMSQLMISRAFAPWAAVSRAAHLRRHRSDLQAMVHSRDAQLEEQGLCLGGMRQSLDQHARNAAAAAGRADALAKQTAGSESDVQKDVQNLRRKIDSVCRGTLTPPPPPPHSHTTPHQPPQTALLLLRILGGTSSKWRGFFRGENSEK